MAFPKHHWMRDLGPCFQNPITISHTCNNITALRMPYIQPWLVWLSGLSTSLRTKGSLVRFPIRAHAWVADQVPSRGRMRGNHTLMILSLSPSLPLSLKINKILKKKKNALYTSIKDYRDDPTPHSHPLR